MRSPIQAVVLSSEIGEFHEEVARVFLELGRQSAPDALTGEFAPPLDVYETDESIEITVDLPGVAVSAVRVLLKRDAVLVVGEKAQLRARSESSFHLVERGFGRFARLVRLSSPCDAARASATLAGGELRVRFPKMSDRRGRTIQIPIQAAPR